MKFFAVGVVFWFFSIIFEEPTAYTRTLIYSRRNQRSSVTVGKGWQMNCVSLPPLGSWRRRDTYRLVSQSRHNRCVGVVHRDVGIRGRRKGRTRRRSNGSIFYSSLGLRRCWRIWWKQSFHISFDVSFLKCY